MKNNSVILMASAVISLIIAGCTGKGHHAHKHHEGGQIGAPTTGMSSSEYQSLVRLDPQNTMKADFSAVKGMDGYFLIDNQGEGTVSVVDYNVGETIKKTNINDFEMIIFLSETFTLSFKKLKMKRFTINIHKVPPNIPVYSYHWIK